MPLTAFSKTLGMELDVEQMLDHISRREGLAPRAKSQVINEYERRIIRDDVECPSCFCEGAEVVSESVSTRSGKPSRQAYFRFPQNELFPGHHAVCDFAALGTGLSSPENVIQFGTAKHALTKLIRDLVCKGVQLGLFDQRTIRDMRQWYFETKIESRMLVTLHPEIPSWLDQISRFSAYGHGYHDINVPLSADMLTIPGFDLNRFARSRIYNRHAPLLATLQRERIWVHRLKGRLEKLATEHHGKEVFNPAALKAHYRATLSFVSFLIREFAPLAKITKGAFPEDARGGNSLLAFASLLLFVNDWDMQRAISLFAKIAKDESAVDTSLGNVIGLNPFHDYGAWEMLLRLQELIPAELVPYDVVAAAEAWKTSALSLL